MKTIEEIILTRCFCQEHVKCSFCDGILNPILEVAALVADETYDREIGFMVDDRSDVAHGVWLASGKIAKSIRELKR